MMQHVLYLVGQPQLGGDDYVSDRSNSEGDGPCGEDWYDDWYDDCEIPSDSENTDIDEYSNKSIDENVDSEEDEEAENDQISDCEGADFTTAIIMRAVELRKQVRNMVWEKEGESSEETSNYN